MEKLLKQHSAFPRAHNPVTKRRSLVMSEAKLKRFCFGPFLVLVFQELFLRQLKQMDLDDPQIRMAATEHVRWTTITRCLCLRLLLMMLESAWHWLAVAIHVVVVVASEHTCKYPGGKKTKGCCNNMHTKHTALKVNTSKRYSLFRETEASFSDPSRVFLRAKFFHVMCLANSLGVPSQPTSNIKY